MDTNRLGRGEMVAAVSAIALLLVMFIFDWFGVGGGSVNTGFGTVDVPGAGANAWQSFGFIDLVLLLTVIVAVGTAAMTANSQSVNLPVAASSLTAGLGILSTVLIAYRILDTPYDSDRKIGVFLGLIAAAGVAYGGWTAMQEEGTSFSAAADQIQDRMGSDRPQDPPPPPPPAPPPPPPPPAPPAS